VFACGVTIFSMVTGNIPFHQAYVNKRGNIKHDPYYFLISQKNYKKYWGEIEKSLRRQNRNFDKNTLSDDFKELFINMVAFEPKERYTMTQIKETNWFKNNTSQNSESKIREKLFDIVKNDKSYIEKIENQNRAAKQKALKLKGELREKSNRFSFDGNN